LINHLIGYWIIDSVEEFAPEYYGQIYLRFTGNNLLQWGYEKPEKICVVSFNYWVEGESIVTVLPPNPRKEFTPYSITPDGQLKLTYSNYETLWARTTEQTFFTSEARWEPDPTMSRPDYMASLQQSPSVHQRQSAEYAGASPQLVVNTNALWRVWEYSNQTFGSFHLDDFKFILERGVISDWRCNEDRTLLMYIAGEGYTEAVHLLLESGFDINAQDLYGDTALNHALYRDRKDTIQLLVARGAKSGQKSE
jgi:Ankyrin repeats (3 copies)